MGLKFKNCLDIDVDIFFNYENEEGERCSRGAGPSGVTGHLSRVQRKDKLPLDRIGLEDDFQLRIKMDHIPREDKIGAIKVVPGTGLGYGHHTEYHQFDDYLLVIIHYKKGKGNKFRDVDPGVYHPDPPNPK